MPLPAPEALLQELTELDSALIDELGVRFSTEPWGDAQFARTLPDKWLFTRVARSAHSGKLVGYWIASRSAVARLHTHRVGVERSSRGSGVGKALYSAVLKAARDARIREVTLLVHRDNDAAGSFYRRLGFRQLLGEDLREAAVWPPKSQLDMDQRHLLIDGQPLRVMIADAGGAS